MHIGMLPFRTLFKLQLMQIVGLSVKQKKSTMSYQLNHS